ncbi:MAG: flagellar motor protein MotD [Burkholderiales bacterium]|nr:flagellar motor protein MotD [Burkholderiales bacterium]
MARKKREEDRDNHERWMISYSDFITLLFAFFVVMYATSSVNEGKYRVFGDSLSNAFLNKPAEPPRTEKIPLVVDKRPVVSESERKILEQQRRERMQSIAQDILSVMSPLVKVGKVKVMQSNVGVTVEINASLLFKSGQAVLEPESVKALQAVAEVLKNDTHDIQVKGYTDNTPIGTSYFPSNWELSSARASSVVRLFAQNGVDPARMVVEGYAENQPVDSNDTADGRSRNRRVTIMILAAAPEHVTDIPVSEQ